MGTEHRNGCDEPRSDASALATSVGDDPGIRLDDSRLEPLAASPGSLPDCGVAVLIGTAPAPRPV